MQLQTTAPMLIRVQLSHLFNSVELLEQIYSLRHEWPKHSLRYSGQRRRLTDISVHRLIAFVMSIIEGLLPGSVFVVLRGELALHVLQLFATVVFFLT